MAPECNWVQKYFFLFLLRVHRGYSNSNINLCSSIQSHLCLSRSLSAISMTNWEALAHLGTPQAEANHTFLTSIRCPLHPLPCSTTSFLTKVIIAKGHTYHGLTKDQHYDFSMLLYSFLVSPNSHFTQLISELAFSENCPLSFSSLFPER